MGKMVQLQMNLLVGISFCDEYADVFEPPGFPAKCEIDHDIELLPGATP